jgi:hypothetical protein
VKRKMARLQRESEQQRQALQEQGQVLAKTQREKQQLQKAHVEAAATEEATADGDKEHICMICLEIVIEPAITGCCTTRFCKSCIEQWKRKGTNKSPCGCRVDMKPGPVVIDHSYWALVQKAFPRSVQRRRDGPNLAQAGAAAAPSAAGGETRAVPNCYCRTPRPAQRRGPAQNPTDPKYKGCYRWVCAKRPLGRGEPEVPHCKFWFWEEPGTNRAPAAAFAGRSGTGGAARGYGAAGAAAVPAPRRTFF